VIACRLQGQGPHGPDLDEALLPVLRFGKVVEALEEPERPTGIGPGEQHPRQHEVVAFPHIGNIVLRRQPAFLRPALGLAGLSLGQQEPRPVRVDEVQQAGDLRARMHPAGFVHGFQGGIHISLGLANPSQGDQPVTRLKEPDHLSAKLDAFGHVLQGVVELISLVEQLGDPDVRLSRVERGEPAALRGKAQGPSVGSECRPEFSSGPLHRRQGVAGRDQGIGVGCRSALGQHLGGNRLGIRQSPAHPVGAGPRKPARPEARPMLLLVFGASSGGVLALEAAARGRSITRLALYEPPFVVDDSRPPLPEDDVARLAELVSAGPRGDAVEYFMTQAAGLPAEAAVPEVSRNVFRREGEYWTVAYEGSVVRLKDAKGLRHLARLLAHPAREFHAADLEAADSQVAPAAPSGPRDRAGSGELEVRPDLGDAGELLDATAKAAYKARLDELQNELDPARAAKARAEMDFLVGELARAVGLGGRDRRAASHAERARLNATRAIRAAMANLARANPSLGRHLSSTIRTGRYCSYTPDPRAPIAWQR